MGENFDLFGEPISEFRNLQALYGENPFTVLDANKWIKRRLEWEQLGINRFDGRGNAKTFCTNSMKNVTYKQTVSAFNPVLCELMYRWFCPSEGRILDPFNGGVTAGLVANILGYDFTGIDIREEQILSNIAQAENICKGKIPNWIVGDANVVLDTLEDNSVDMVWTCPPYGDLEVYSDLEGDISNMSYADFLVAYRSIIAKCAKKLKDGCYMGLVVGEFRDKRGNYVGFVPDTITACKDAGLNYYNEAILIAPYGTAAFRAVNNMKHQKLVKVHQNVLIFKK